MTIKPAKCTRMHVARCVDLRVRGTERVIRSTPPSKSPTLLSTAASSFSWFGFCARKPLHGLKRQGGHTVYFYLAVMVATTRWEIVRNRLHETIVGEEEAPFGRIGVALRTASLYSVTATWWTRNTPSHWSRQRKEWRSSGLDEKCGAKYSVRSVRGRVFVVILPSIVFPVSVLCGMCQSPCAAGVPDPVSSSFSTWSFLFQSKCFSETPDHEIAPVTGAWRRWSPKTLLHYSIQSFISSISILIFCTVVCYGIRSPLVGSPRFGQDGATPWQPGSVLVTNITWTKSWLQIDKNGSR